MPRRLGKLFLTQLVLNATFGAVIGLGLTVIRCPECAALGTAGRDFSFCTLYRRDFAAALPTILAAAVGSDWTMTLWTVLLFAIVEPLTGHVR